MLFYSDPITYQEKHDQQFPFLASRTYQTLDKTSYPIRGFWFNIFGSLFSAVAVSSGIKEVKTPYRTPQANGICERFMGSLRRECLDHILIRDDKHLARVVTEYTTFFIEDRPHQGIGQRIPGHYDLPTSKPIGRIRSRAILNGLHHSYSRATTLN